ncbi:hypothetical protein, partial [Streptomyces thermogriseus]|uniref:hypothetical protein n=1 Tax=Streptomyces thermogriseus TaxID=75292 RepID=UPI0031F82845
LWQQAGVGLTASLGQAELARMRRQGITALTTDQGLTALDAALVHDQPHLVPVRLDLTGLSSHSHEIPPLLRGLVRAPRRRAGEAEGASSGLRERLLALPAGERAAHLVRVVQQEAAV